MRLPVLAILAILFSSAAAAGDAVPRLFQPPRRPSVPVLKNTSWPRNSIDAFILARLEAKEMEPSRPADRLRLLRRVMFDLIGLPPTIEEQDAFLRDRSVDAYERLVDRLLASPQFGERQAQHWLDLVRYAESDGFKEDALRPDAHKYRDHVIRAFNANVPYDVFVRRQIAGDELEPGNVEALIATGLNRLWPDEWNAANLEQRRQEILDDTTDTAGMVFLGLTVGCARCHNHKHDPISQREYFRLQAFFAAMQPRDLPAVDAATRREHERQVAAWEAATREIRLELEKIVSAKRKQLREEALTKFRAEIKEAVRTPEDRRTPYQQIIALIAQKQMDRAGNTAPDRLPQEAKKRYQELQRKLVAMGTWPAPMPLAMGVTDVGPIAPPTHRLIGGDWRKPAAEVGPGFPAVLGGGPVGMYMTAAKGGSERSASGKEREAASGSGGEREEASGKERSASGSTGRRSALARWLTGPRNPLTARVMVNRLWQHHFGVGIVATPSDFGAQGTPPSHPGLLDWLAVEFVESGWDLKHMHRLMVTSNAYRQDSAVDAHNPIQARGLAVDRGNILLWHANRRRLEGEALRDSMLALSGELNLRMFGPSSRPILPAGVSKYAWKADVNPPERHRRSIYVLAQRNQRYPLFEAFDLPDMHNSCPCRTKTTTAPQSLVLLNSRPVLRRAGEWARRLRASCGEDDSRLVLTVFAAAWGRPAASDEVERGRGFLERTAKQNRAEGMSPEAAHALAVEMFCHALMCTNEFAYID
jgi:hypothetical protein